MVKVDWYPRSERPIYQHSWLNLDVECTDDEEEPDDAESDLEIRLGLKIMHVEGWLEDVE